MRTFTATSVLALTVLSSAAHAGEFAYRGKLYAEGAVAFTSFGGEVSSGGLSGDLDERTQIIGSGTFGAFIVDGFFLGGALTINHVSVGDFSSTSVAFAVVPRYYIGLNPTRSLFVKLGGTLGYELQSQGDSDVTGILAGFEAGLAVALGEEKGGIIDFGPFITKEWLSDGDFDFDATTVGFKVGFGGYF